MARRIHFSRLLDFLSGSALAGANTKVQRSALYKDFNLAQLEDKKLRQLIDANLPTLYVVDIDTITKELADGLGFSNFQENEDYVSQKFPSKAELLKFIFKTVESSILSLPKGNFQNSIVALNNEYKILLNTLSSATTYNRYRNAAAKFAYNMRKILKGSGVYLAEDAQSFISSLNKNAYVIIGPTFNSAVEAVNTKLNADIRAAFVKSYDINLKAYSAKADAKNRFTIGDYINAGHTAAYTDQNKLIGVNMPLIQEKQFLLSSDPKSEGLETAIAPLYLQADYAIKFNQNFTETATMLLDMQFSFTITMPSKFNTAVLRTQEVQRIKNYIGTQVLPTIAEQARKKFAGGIVEQLIDTGASPSTREFITQAIKSTIQGTPVKRQTKPNKASKSNKNAIPTFAIVKKSKPTKVKQKSGGIKFKPQKLPVSLKAETNLVSLQNLINSLLHQQIRQNMGDGNRRDVLNYRTGRFAESARVEQLTQGRSGMITAYYTYMKYPYATFSAGGEQEFPRSRDPKLLISQSIREIAQQQMITRMRAQVI